MCRRLIVPICFVLILGMVMPAVANAGTQASSPDPENGSKYVLSDVIVSWVAGDSAADTNGHDVYFGTDFNDVNNATTSSSGIYMGRQSDNIFDTNDYDANELTGGQTYYWRIDEANGVSTWKGSVWSFTVEVYINVKTDLVSLGIYGSNAAGDGSTDDTDAIEAAIDWVDINTPYGGTLYCPAGTYRISDISVCNDVEIRGAGTSQTIFRPLEDSGGSALIRLKDRGSLRDFTAYGAKPSQSGANWEAGVGGPSYVILARYIYDGAVIDNVFAHEGKYDPLYLRGTTGLRVTNSDFDRAGRAIVSIDAADGYDRQFVFGWNWFGPLRGQYLFNMEPASGEGDYIEDGIFISNDFYCEDSGDYGTAENYWGCFLSFKGVDEEPYICRDIMVLDCDFEDTHIWVNKIFNKAYFVKNDIDSISSGYSCFEADYEDCELTNVTIRDNDFIGASGTEDWSQIRDGVTFTGDSTFVQCNTPEWANYSGCSWPDCNEDNENLLAATDDISELSHAQLWDITKDCAGEFKSWYYDHHWELGEAKGPWPVNQQTNVSRTDNLTWDASYRATSYRVYFGTSSPGTYQDTQTGTSFSPGVMAANTTYYWRIDGTRDGGEKTGAVWSFTTGTTGSAPGQPGNPDPCDSQSNVSRNADLSWGPGEDADSYDLYFGTSSPGTFQDNQTDTSFDPGTMDADTTYYWRIDSVNPFGTTTGTVWSFTTSATFAEYTDAYDVWYASADNTWQTKSLSGYGVPANSVVEILLLNTHTSYENRIGVRAVGSGLNRTVDLHEAESNGWDVMTMHVQANASSQIQHFAEDCDNMAFILVGWWNSGTYVEKMSLFTIQYDNTWVDVDLSSYNVPGNRVAEIVLADNTEGYEAWAGVRTNGSSLGRVAELQEAEGGGVDTVTMLVKTDADGKIEAYAEDDVDVYFYLVGYWSEAPGTFTEKTNGLGKPPYSDTWCDKDLSGYGVPANAVTEILCYNAQSDYENWIGVRKNGSNKNRMFKLHEAESGGWDCASVHAMTDGNSKIEHYFDDIGDAGGFVLLGYWQ